MGKIKRSNNFVQRVAAKASDTVLPTIKALVLHVQRPIRRSCLVDAGEHLVPSLATPAVPEEDAYYEFRRVRPPDTLDQLVKNGATLRLSRTGTVRVWLGGKIVAAESDADCQAHGARKLNDEEFFYATVFLFWIGARWSDPDAGEE